MLRFWPLTRLFATNTRLPDSHDDADLSDAALLAAQRSSFFPRRRSAPPSLVFFAVGKGRPNKTSKKDKHSKKPRNPSASVKNQEQLSAPPGGSSRSRRKVTITQKVEVLGRVTSAPLIVGQADALSILLEPRLYCTATQRHTTATPNSAAEKTPELQEMLRPVLVWQEWDEVRPIKLQKAFLAAVKPVQQLCMPQTERILANEADASNAFLANIVDPIFPIISDFVAPDYQPFFELAVMSEVTPDTKGDGNIRLDHLIRLVDKPVHKLRRGEKRRLVVKNALVIIEMKRHALVRPTDWPADLRLKPRRLNKGDARANELLPQLLMYSKYWCCPCVYLSAYTETMAYNVEYERLRENSDGHLPLSFAVCSDTSKKHKKSVYDYGERMSLAFDVFAGLKELGVLDPKFLPGVQMKLDARLHERMEQIKEARKAQTK
ncbi:hypothetical protein JCM10450v2_004731 [Rhodotorula kratochvilovae]